MSEGIDLTEILGIDREVALELAQTSSAIARARAQDESEPLKRDREPEAARSGQTIGQVNLASLSQVDVGVLQTATLATQAAVNLLVVDRASQARDLFRLASRLVAPYSTNDSVVLGTCADPLAAAPADIDDTHGTVSPWILDSVALVHLASGPSRSFENFGATSPNGWAGAGASGEPPPGLSLASLIQLRIALSGAMPSDGPRVWNGLLERLDALVVDATSPYGDVVGAEWWANQTGSLFPLEPEVLMLGLIGAIWRQRGLEFGTGGHEHRLFASRDRLPRLALAVSVAADRLL